MISTQMKTLNRFAQPRQSSQQETKASAPIDRVQLSGNSQPIYELAAHLERATQEFLDLVATHPTEQEEFLHGAQEIQKIVSEILYDGRWPDAEEMPKLPAHKKPGSREDNGGLTKSEQLVSDDLVLIYRKTSGSVKTPDQHKRLAFAIHLCQSGLQGRVLRRDYPTYWMSSPGTLEKDAQREAERWG